MTVIEAAKQLGCSKDFVYKLCARGRLGYSRIGFGQGRIQISADQLDAYRRAREALPLPDADDREWAQWRARVTGIPDVLSEFRRKSKRRPAG